MPRPTKQQIDDEIIDCAAMLFARHGFKETSVQRIADAVGYSKTGLLHRYPSKKALQAAVIERCVSEMRTVSAEVAGMPPGPARDRAAMTVLTRTIQRRPGFVALLLTNLVSPPDSDIAAVLRPIGEAVLEAFSLTPDTEEHARLARVAGALGAVAVARVALRDHPIGDKLDLLIDIGYDALGHRDPADR
jgi:AcrR family transcriptional regulator